MGYLQQIREAKEKRIAEVLTREPLLTNTQLKERFGCNSQIIAKLRKKLRIPAQQSEYVTKDDMKTANASFTYDGDLDPFSTFIPKKKRKRGTKRTLGV
jgi:hypothetical protein